MILLPPEGKVIYLDDYRKRDNVVAIDARRFDLASLTREVREEMERAEDYPLDAA